ncbi:hypothetical protein [Saccharothrix sp. Mg75]|uniref:hypothetical protein n=1 Tax=Saccharothrix sp. Mg75 TaxID=3445357 RepID=UPI003EED83D0
MEQAVKVSAAVWLDYVLSPPRKRREMMKAHVRRYLDPQAQAYHYYNTILAAMPRAISSVDPTRVMEECVAGTREAHQELHYREIAAGFLTWRSRTKGTQVKVNTAAWTHAGLTATLSRLFGLRQPDGSELVILPYLKAEPLTQDAASLILLMMEDMMPDLRPGATAAILDTRRGQLHTLRKNANRRDIRAQLVGEAAGYVAFWQAITLDAA